MINSQRNAAIKEKKEKMRYIFKNCLAVLLRVKTQQIWQISKS